MIGYVTVGVNDMSKAKTFYTELLRDFGAKVLVDMGRIAFIGKSMDAPMISVCRPYNEEDPAPGNGVMIAFPAGSKEKAKALHTRALELGASCEGEPGQRIPDTFYGAYVKDPDGNKIAFYEFG